MRFLLWLTPLLLVSGCFSEDAEIDYEQACKEQPSFCKAFEVPVDCKKAFELSSVRYTQYELSKSGDDAYHFATALSGFKACNITSLNKDFANEYRRDEVILSDNSTVRGLQLKQQLEFSKRKSGKLKNESVIEHFELTLAQDKAIRPSSLYLYWLWTVHESDAALSKLLVLLEQNEVSESLVLYGLSQHLAYTKNSQYFNALYKSLSNYPTDDYAPLKKAGKPSDEPLHIAILRDITKSHYSNKNYKSAYIFANILKINQDSSVNLDLIFSKMTDDEKSALDKWDSIAKAIDKQISEGRFKAS